MFISILSFIFVLGILVVLHEAGHFLVARLLGAPVEVFSVGFGKRLWGFERGGTDYRLSAIPIGGYVRILGLGPDESDVVGDGAEEIELLARWKRALILFAGPITNVIAAVGFVAVAFMIGHESPAYFGEKPVVGWVEPESPAAGTGVAEGDLVTAVDGTRVATWRDLEMTLLSSAGQELVLQLERDGQPMEVSITPRSVTRYGLGYSGLLPPLDTTVVGLMPGAPAMRAGVQPGDQIIAVNGEPVDQFYDLIRLISPQAEKEVTIDLLRDGEQMSLKMVPEDFGGEGKIGISLIHPTEVRHLGLGEAVREATFECYRMTIETFRVIGRLLSRKASIRQVSGPIDIARISGEAARSGIRSLIWLMGVISLQLGIFNLLPIPILDGGHLTIIGFESIIRRDLSIKVKERILEIGFYLIILLFVVIMFSDIVKNLPQGVQDFFFGSS
jgi:regulator of sigma E protease